MLKTLDWFTARIGKDVVRTYNGNDTVVTIVKNEKADHYMFGLQDEGFTFRDTAETIAEASTVPQETFTSGNWNLEQYKDNKVSTKPKITIAEGGACTFACEG